MKSKGCKDVTRYCLLFLIFIITCTFFVIVYILKARKPPICIPKNPHDAIVDHEDEWQYQNTITGEWYRWRTVYKKQNYQNEWRINWLNVPPKSYLGVIVYLATYGEIKSLQMSLTLLSRVLSNNPRPIVIFHEGDFSSNDTQQSLAQTIGNHTPLAFERIKFAKSKTPPCPDHQNWPSGYFHMCRFFTLMLPSHPLLTLFTYYWRLDTHSFVHATKPIEDPFNIMQQRNIQYAFAMAHVDMKQHVLGLWSFFLEFLNTHCITPSTPFRETQSGRRNRNLNAIIFTNFAIANVSLFRDHSLMQAWLHTVDRNGGIYRYRWGDAPIHTLGVTQFLSRDQVAHFRYFGYIHRDEYVCSPKIRVRACKELTKPLLTNPSYKYRLLPAGCYPLIDNPICHYFPEVIL